jgi:hypothetical protein
MVMVVVATAAEVEARLGLCRSENLNLQGRPPTCLALAQRSDGSGAAFVFFFWPVIVRRPWGPFCRYSISEGNVPLFGRGVPTGPHPAAGGVEEREGIRQPVAGGGSRSLGGCSGGRRPPGRGRGELLAARGR